MAEQCPTLRMSSITALQLIKEYHVAEPEEEQRHKHMQNNDPSWAHLDWVGAKKWCQFISVEIRGIELNTLCRLACSSFILSNLILLELTSHGRESLINNLSNDELQVFRNAGLLEKSPNAEIVQWWDEMRIRGRKILDASLLLQGRKAERWTIENEIKLTASFGKEYIPTWVALDGDYYGYDILSYRADTDGTPYTVFIEVKSFSKISQPHFYVTSNEWQKAIEASSNYLFVVWCIETKDFRELSLKEIEPHIPLNRGQGLWQNVLIKVDNW